MKGQQEHKYMSTPSSMFRSLPSTFMPELQRQAWGRFFGRGIQSLRVEAGLTVVEAACLAGMEIVEWAVIEEGIVPRNDSQLHAMADAMAVEYDKFLNLVVLCRASWEL